MKSQAGTDPRIPRLPLLAQLAAPAIAIPAAWRFMGASAGLDKGEVTDRVINVVKNFNKVDPAKVRPRAHR